MASLGYYGKDASTSVSTLVQSRQSDNVLSDTHVADGPCCWFMVYYSFETRVFVVNTVASYISWLCVGVPVDRRPPICGFNDVTDSRKYINNLDMF